MSCYGFLRRASFPGSFWNLSEFFLTGQLDTKEPGKAQREVFSCRPVLAFFAAWASFFFSNSA